jgi:excisionase family DNA binding protein
MTAMDIETIRIIQDEVRRVTLLVQKKALTMDEAVLLTGLKKSYLYRLCSTRKIPHHKSEGGKVTYFDRQELEDWMLHQKVDVI